jgi:GNAT superfamily N-acetyltransferase
MTPQVFLHSIRAVSDPLLLPWLDLYETAFPFNERILVSNILRSLPPFSTHDSIWLLALLDAEKTFAGLAMFQRFREQNLGFLYYLAIQPERRSQGLGGAFYGQAAAELFQEVSLLVFEVEKPELAEDAEKRQLAQRRIRFYQRQGARLLRGVEYLQSVGSHCLPTPMHLMFQARAGVDLTPATAYEAVAPILQDSVKQIQDFSWLE